MRFYNIKHSLDLICNGVLIDTCEETTSVSAKDMAQAVSKLEKYLRSRNHDFKLYREKNDETGKMDKFQFKNLEVISCELIHTSEVD